MKAQANILASSQKPADLHPHCFEKKCYILSDVHSTLYQVVVSTHLRFLPLEPGHM